MSAARLEADWRLAGATAGLTLLGTLAFLIVDGRGAGLAPLEGAVRLAHILGSAVVLGLLWLRRRHPTRALALGATAAVLLPFLPSLWLSETTAAALGRPWTPFVGHKLVTSCVAILVPGPAWFGAGVLVALELEEVALWRHLDLGAHGSEVAVDEPWASVAHGVVVAAVFAYRTIQRRVEYAHERERAEAAALEARAEMVLAALDLANTPLQSLEIGVALVQRRVGDDSVARRALESMTRSLLRLRKLNALLEPDRRDPAPGR